MGFLSEAALILPGNERGLVMLTEADLPSPPNNRSNTTCKPIAQHAECLQTLPTHARELLEVRLAQTIAAYDADAVGYATRFEHVDLAEHRARLLGQSHQTSDFVLDAGCGPGRDLTYFARDGVQAIGLDMSSELLRVARRQGHRVIQADLRDIPTKSNVFSGVWACASLVHLTPSQMREALSEFRRVLRPGGRIFVTVRHGSGVEERTDTNGNTRWFYFYSASTVERLLIESGFVDVDATVDPGAAHGTWVNVHARSAPCDGGYYSPR